MIELSDGGIASTVQDRGRFGQYHIGMPPSGAMDQYAHTVANYLVGNAADSSTIEMTYQGITATFHEDAVIAVTGADMSPSINGEPIKTWTTHAVESGDELEFEFATEGARAYLAVAGGIDVPEVMGSQSTYTLVGIGGHEGRGLEAGDKLSIGDQPDEASDFVGTQVADEHIPNYADEDTVRVVLGLTSYRLTDESKEQLCNAEWKVSAEADRVGYRLEGPDLEFKEREQPFGAGTDPSNVVDLGYPVGSIQVPQSPIVLMQDAVTGGGYATVGTVISTDRGRLSQRQTHKSVYFEEVDVEAALDARNEQEDQLEQIRSEIRSEI
ncbi:putative biotin-dependent carboxyltransferase (plasmid) [Natrialba magadii ATCC 43099]|uniref:Biotin-dependent carboxyltransferase n=1 Tax=Natrialba magadii (strain ATCC 43099 / DSM 3394 / CCM 3739 / CIP 104546 / IAM 13178 / JCM 8861 / NBRC 102185 / NCIMB 2190 / MS3) TaxID=547559 RepID=D3T1W1_NATMM|nr:biotin-dependent carboxyltransferase family protein [Natrialba magadii]ADD07570.1 putative biotin-dependent carboxyltransferase [Natrialba magadii ATCC 43099]ELY27210.1 urea amidolyase-like protein [Natrialba magadii ATCC 43099]